MSASAHKFNGPRGVGLLYIRDGITINPLLYGGHQQNNARAGTENVPGIIGMAVALNENNKKIQNSIQHISTLESTLIRNLKNNNLDFIINGDIKNKIDGILNLSFNSILGESIVDISSMRGVCISTGSACNSGIIDASHVLKAISVNNEYINGTIRVSFGKDNTLEEVNELSAILIDVIKHLSDNNGT